MKKLLFWAIFSPAVAWAQGGLGYFYVGTGVFDAGKYQSALRESLGPEFEAVGPGIHFGGRGMGGAGNRVMVGGNGFGGMFASGENANGSAEIRAGMGFFNVGVVAVAQNRTLLIPYLGIGGGGTTVRIKNENPASAVYFDRSTAVGYERVRNYTNSGFAAELGMTLQFVLTGKSDNPGGLALGLELGGLFRAPGRWRDSDGNAILGPERMGFQGAYLRLTIGGGSLEIKNRKNKTGAFDDFNPPSEN
jgi:hypothetical protein